MYIHTSGCMGIWMQWDTAPTCWPGSQRPCWPASPGWITQLMMDETNKFCQSTNNLTCKMDQNGRLFGCAGRNWVVDSEWLVMEWDVIAMLLPSDIYIYIIMSKWKGHEPLEKGKKCMDPTHWSSWNCSSGKPSLVKVMISLPKTVELDVFGMVILIGTLTAIHFISWMYCFKIIWDDDRNGPIFSGGETVETPVGERFFSVVFRAT